MANVSAILSRIGAILTTSHVTFASTFAGVAISGQSSGLNGPSPWTQYISSGLLTGHALTGFTIPAFQGEGVSVTSFVLEPERTRGVVVAAGAVQVPITVEREGPTETVIDTPRPGRMIIKKKPAV